jgi:eukaryotic-like serine/threonine-protein kinase
MAYQAGQQVGDYQILDVLGGGGMGTVYRVRNSISGRVEAMKVLLENLQGNAEILDRFLREIRVLAALEHPNIAALRTAQRLDEQILMIMELVEGDTLQALMKRGRIPPASAVRYVRDALAGLAVAHERGVVHRDIKPANMMLNRQGVLKLMDFGIARLATDRQLTKTGLTMGSVFYMSPEQINGAEVDARSDIYSMGITLYELVTGRRPFEGESDYSIMAAHIQQTPRPPIELDASLPPELNQIVLLALEKDPAKRFQSAVAMKNALDRVLEKLEGRARPAVAPTAAAPQSTATPVVQAPVMKQGSGARVVWILAGSLATLAVIVVAAVQIPKWRSTQAVETPAVIEQPAGTTEEALQQPEQPRPAEQTPATAEVPPSSQSPAATQPPRTVTAPAQTVTQPRPAAVEQTPAEPAGYGQTTTPAQTPRTPTYTPEPVTQAPAAETPPPARNDAALSEARERLILMSTRVGAVRQTLEALKQSQARMGLGLRQDYVAGEQRLIYRLDEAEAALRSGNAAKAGEQLDAAERDLTTLERALRR